MRFKHIEGKRARWLEELAQFYMEIVHRSGKKPNNADGLSVYQIAYKTATVILLDRIQLNFLVVVVVTVLIPSGVNLS